MPLVYNGSTSASFAAEVVPETVIAAVLLLHERSVDEISRLCSYRASLIRS
jgi:hypothetical protein